MTTTATRPASAAKASSAGNPWLPTFAGVSLVARIELLRRRPTRKGYIVYGVLLGLIVLLSALAAINAGEGKSSSSLELILIMVLGTGFLIGPSLSATAINGDSSEGVLAPMQMTRLTAGDLAVGKLLATWGITLIAIATTAPFLWYAFTRSGWHGDELARVMGVILLLVLAATATGLAWSAIAARPAISVALTHLTSGFMAIGTLIVFAFTLPLVTEDVTVMTTDRDTSNVTEAQWLDPTFNPDALPCTQTEQQVGWTHTDRTAWMLLINPIMVIGESSPVIDPVTAEADGRAQPGIFATVHQMVSDARMGQDRPVDQNWCDMSAQDESVAAWQKRQAETYTYPPMPWVGLGFSVALGTCAMTLVIRRLRVPYKTLRAGTRVA